MAEQSGVPVIEYFSDLLCVWAWIAQPRLEALEDEFAGRIVVRQRYLDVFGSAHRKILGRWGQDKGFAAFGEHVHASAQPFPDARLSDALWQEVRPSSSLPAHTLIHAVNLVAGVEAANRYARRVREAFFTEAQDISEEGVLMQLAEQLDIATPDLAATLNSGAALAGVAEDQQSANAARLRGSPSWLMNNGRQLLYGNVGYRVLSANVEALLTQGSPGASWC